jgi:hypothetical protein
MATANPLDKVELFAGLFAEESLERETEMQEASWEAAHALSGCFLLWDGIAYATQSSPVIMRDVKRFATKVGLNDEQVLDLLELMGWSHVSGRIRERLLHK